MVYPRKKNKYILNKDDQHFKVEKERNKSKHSSETTQSEKLRYKHADQIYDE